MKLSGDCTCAAAHPTLAPTPDLARARQTLELYRAPDPAQERTRQQMLDFIAAHPHDAHQRECRPGHLTASALVLHADGEHVLLLHHRKLERWLQLGGHCDGDANLAGVALREASEESGIPELAIFPQPIDLDIHLIPARLGEPAHFHYDTRFLVLAPPQAQPVQNDESHALSWWPLNAVQALDDPSLQRLLRILGRP